MPYHTYSFGGGEAGNVSFLIEYLCICTDLWRTWGWWKYQWRHVIIKVEKSTRLKLVQFALGGRICSSLIEYPQVCLGRNASYGHGYGKPFGYILPTIATWQRVIWCTWPQILANNLNQKIHHTHSKTMKICNVSFLCHSMRSPYWSRELNSLEFSFGYSTFLWSSSHFIHGHKPLSHTVPIKHFVKYFSTAGNRKEVAGSRILGS